MLAMATLLAPALCAHADLAVNDAPYSPIIARNIFGLLPIPTNAPVDPNATPATPPPKIVPNGLMSLFGVPQALFKVSYPPAGGQPAHDESYMLAQGESQDNIEVTKIDMANAVVSFNNNGTMQDIPLAAAPKITSPAAPVGGSGGVGGVSPGGIPRPLLGGPRGIAGLGAATAASAAGSGGGQGSDGNTAPSLAPSEGNSRIYNPATESDGLTPESQAVLATQAYINSQKGLSQDGSSSGPKVNPALFPQNPLRGQADAYLNGQ